MRIPFTYQMCGAMTKISATEIIELAELISYFGSSESGEPKPLDEAITVVESLPHFDVRMTHFEYLMYLRCAFHYTKGDPLVPASSLRKEIDRFRDRLKQDGYLITSVSRLRARAAFLVATTATLIIAPYLIYRAFQH